MKLYTPHWQDGDPIPEDFAFGRIPEEGRFALSANLSPKFVWEDAPEGTRSFVMICHDPDVPSKPDDVNQEGRSVSKSLPRVDFYHWVLVDIPASVTMLEQGQASQNVVARGKPFGEKPYGTAGVNSYTDWFAGDPDMEGPYGDYDGPCPPWNDELRHRYIFTLYALDCETLNLKGAFTGPQALEAMQGHVLASAFYRGTYTMNPDLRP